MTLGAWCGVSWWGTWVAQGACRGLESCDRTGWSLLLAPLPLFMVWFRLRTQAFWLGFSFETRFASCVLQWIFVENVCLLCLPLPLTGLSVMPALTPHGLGFLVVLPASHRSCL